MNRWNNRFLENSVYHDSDECNRIGDFLTEYSSTISRLWIETMIEEMKPVGMGNVSLIIEMNTY